MTAIRVITIAALLQLAATVPTVSRGSVEGTVIRAGSGEPIEDIRVVLIPTAIPDSLDASQRVVSPLTTTDAQGRFELKDVEPGQYRLTFAGNGYVRQEYNQRVFPGSGTPINVASGQSVKDLLVNLMPTGSVSGTIRDRDRRPLAGVPVQLLRDSYDQSGERRIRPNSTVVKTDDRGEFRIFFVTPGRYFLNAGTPQGPPGTGDLRPSANEVYDTFAYTYFPGVLNIGDATPIEVQAGSTKTGMDFTVNRIRGVRVSGRVIDGVTGAAPDKADIKLEYRDPGTPWDYDLEYRGRGKVSYKDGNFEFRDVLPGLFAVFVSMEIPGQPPEARKPALQRIGYVPVEVANSNVDGIVVTLSPGSPIAGRVRIDGRSNLTGVLSGAFPDPGAKPGINLEPRTNGTMPGTPGMPAPPYAAMNLDNGSFQIENVLPGEYHIGVSWMRPSYYIKEAHLGAIDVLNVPFQFTGHEQGDLEIVVSPNSASIGGTVTNNRMAPAVGAQVVLIPDKIGHRPELYKSATSDAAGHFRLSNITPGDYKLYAWEAIELFRWFDRDYVKEDERLAQTVHLGESDRQVADARLIPKK